MHTNNAPDAYSGSRYRPEIDGLRAVAITAVIINHFSNDILPSGYLGVDIFFVLSGFVITSSLLAHPEKSLGEFLTGFYTRRIKRLVPALVVFVVGGSVLICLLNPSPGASLRTGVAALFGLSNLYLLKQSTDYFAAATELNIFTHTWSLGVEEQFYFLFPLLAWLTGFGRLTPDGSARLLRATTALSLASVIGAVYLYTTNQPAAYFLMPTRLWELGAGCLLFLGLQNAGKGIRLLAGIPPLMVMLAAVGVLFAPLRLAVPATIAIVALTVISLACLRVGTAGYGLLTRRPVVYLGRISYSLYLWHWGVLCLSRWTIGIHWWSAPIQVALMLLLANASYRYIEAPLRRSAWADTRWKTIGYGVGLSLAGSIVVLTALRFSPMLNLDTIFPSKLATTLKERSNWGKQIDKGCHLSYSVSRLQMEDCLIKEHSPGARATGNIYIIGDSHANQYVRALKAQIPDHPVRSFTIGWGCGYVQDEDIEKYRLNQRINCSLYNQLVNEFIESGVNAGDIVILGHRWLEKRKYAGRKASIYQLALRLSKNGASLVLLDDAAELGVDDPLLCEKRWWRPLPPPVCMKSLAEVVNDQSSADRMHEELAGTMSNSHAVSLRTLYCTKDGWCGPYLGDLAVYSDGSHLTAAASAIGAKKLTKLLMEIMKPSI